MNLFYAGKVLKLKKLLIDEIITLPEVLTVGDR